MYWRGGTVAGGRQFSSVTGCGGAVYLLPQLVPTELSTLDWKARLPAAARVCLPAVGIADALPVGYRRFKLFPARGLVGVQAFWRSFSGLCWECVLVHRRSPSGESCRTIWRWIMWMGVCGTWMAFRVRPSRRPLADYQCRLSAASVACAQCATSPWPPSYVFTGPRVLNGSGFSWDHKGHRV